MTDPAFLIDGQTYSGAAFRRLLKTFYGSADSRGGVISGLAVSQAAGSSVKVSVGSAWISDSSGGAYIGAIQADTAAITITPTSTGDRTDTVYAIVNDPGSGGTAGQMSFGVATNTNTVPALSIPLARVTAHNDGSITITDARVFVSTAPDAAADTGWVSLAPGILAGFVVPSGYPCVVRRRGKTVRLIAWMTEPNVADFSKAHVPVDVLQLPAWAVPLYSETGKCYSNADAGNVEAYASAQYVIHGTNGPSLPGGGAGMVTLRLPAVTYGPVVAQIAATWLVE